MNRSGLAAIAAATALISTPALGQEASTTVAEPAPIVADEPLMVEPLPVPEATPAPETPTDTLAPAAAAPVIPTQRPARITAAPTARAASPVVRNEAPAATAPAAPTATAASTDALPPVDPAMVAPLPEPAAATVAPVGDSVLDDDMIPIAGAAGLAILAVAGAGFAMRRRRRNTDEVMVEENWPEPTLRRPAPVVSPKPIAASAPVAASAFGWNSAPRQSSPVATAAPANRIEAAKRGPTPDNPSLSLKKRLKRAAFFDQRDRQIAAGTGTPIMANAGLPDALATTSTIAPAQHQPVQRPKHGMTMSFGRTFQPA